MSHPHPSNFHLVHHPLISDLLTTVRDKNTKPPRFRELIRQLGGLLAYESTRDIALTSQPIDTPLEPCNGHRLATNITIVPILRAGLGMADGALQVFTNAQVGHLGMQRDEKTLEPICYYEKFPPDIADHLVMVIDPMLATAGSAIAAIDHLKKRGCQSIRLVNLVAAPAGAKNFADHHPDVPVYIAAMDRQLSDIGYILPGLGDAGDRMFGTL